VTVVEKLVTSKKIVSANAQSAAKLTQFKKMLTNQENLEEFHSNTTSECY
jgi:hypothetical protein